jgi:uncharacterized membrane protein SpoIIM required for sporulation
MKAALGTGAWVNARAPAWRELSQRIGELQRRRRVSISEALSAVEAYRNVARDLASARRLVPGTRTAAALEALFTQIHATISRHPSGGWPGLLSALRDDIPAVAHELAPRIFWMATLMILSAGAGFWLIDTYPHLINLVASEAMIQHVEEGKLWTDGIMNVTPSSILSVRILSNNIVVTLFAVCGGFLFGLGTFYLIALNGLMLGAIFAFVHQHGLAGKLFEFIIAHGLVELSVICIAGAIGATIADSLIRPTHGTRVESFRNCVRRVAPLMSLCAVLLVGAGLIEGFISPDPMFPMASRIVIGASYWIVMVLTLGGWLIRKPKLPSEHSLS